MAVPLAGCASRWEWVKEGVSGEEQARDIAKCRKDAEERDRQQPFYDEIGGPPPSPSWWIEQFFDECMRAKGYHAVRVQDDLQTAAR